jgi:hypothetical protein
MVNKNSNQPKSKVKESLTSKKRKPVCQPLADLIRQINEMSNKVKTSQSPEPEPPTPLAA